MKKLFVFITLILTAISTAQITVINTGTTDKLSSISVIKGNVLVSGYTNYLAKCYDDCNSMIPMSSPNFTESTRGFSVIRVDTNILFMNYIAVPYIYRIWKSYDGGVSWRKKFDTSGVHLQLNSTNFFDSINGVSICLNSKTILTNSAMKTWTLGAWNNNYPSPNVSVWGDSTIIFGDLEGGAYISKNMGNSWQGTSGIDFPARDFEFLNKDTVFCISNPAPSTFSAGFHKSLNGGYNWDCTVFTGGNPIGWSQPELYLLKLCAKKWNEIYILCRDGLTSNGYQGYGVVLKTMDLGKTWSSFKTPYKQNLNDMKFINDSTALICGDNGLLFKWNSKTSVFTNLKENSGELLDLKLFPNPTKNKLSFSSSKIHSSNFKMRIINSLGQVLILKNDFKLEEELDISFLPQGIYSLKIEADIGQRVYKIIKE